MRRWLVVALIPGLLVALHVAVVLFNDEVFRPEPRRYANLSLLIVEAVGLGAVGVALGRRWAAPGDGMWSLPFGMWLGFLPWSVLSVPRPEVVIGLMAGWAFATMLLGRVVAGLLRVAPVIGQAVAGLGWAALLVLLPYLAVRDQLGPEAAPWRDAPLWTAVSLFEPEGFGSSFATHLVVTRFASPLTIMVLLGTGLFLGAVVGGHRFPERQPLARSVPAV